MDTNDKIILNKAISEMCEKYNVPNIDDTKQYECINLSTYCLTPECISDIIYQKIKEDLIKGRKEATFIYLYVPLQEIREQQKRIMQRGRPMEVAQYSDIENLKRVNEQYIWFVNRYMAGGLLLGTEI